MKTDATHHARRFVASSILGRSGLGCVALASLLVALVGCTSAPPPRAGGTHGADSAEDAARFAKSRKLLADGQRSERARELDRARASLKQAAALGVESDRFAIEETLEKVDRRQAKLWANEATEKLDQRDCLGAFKDLASAMKTLESEAFVQELRHLVGAKATTCVASVLEERRAAGKLGAARALVSAAETKAVLGPVAWKKANAELDAVVTDAMRALVAPDVKAKKWSDATAKLDEAVKAGDASETQAAAGLEVVRQTLVPELTALATKAVGQRDAAATLKEIGELVKLCRWEILSPDLAELQKDKALPDDLRGKVDVLAVWAEAQRLSAKVLKRGEKRWVLGTVGVTPPAKSDGTSKRDFTHATEVWVIAETKSLALVSDAETAAPLSAALEKATGWVPLAGLSRKSTADWLLPGDQLQGERVWGPLRPPSADFELGIVTLVSGKDVTVKRLADYALVKVPRSSLRSGRLAVGTKVITFCTARDQPAVIQELLTAGRAQPGVKLKCDSGQEKEELLPSLRTRADLLPKAGP